MKMPLSVSAILIMLFISCNRQYSKDKAEMQIMETAFKANMNDFIEFGWNKKDMTKVRALLTENYIRNLNGIQVANNQKEMEANMNIFFTGFPDLKITINNIQIKDNQAFTHWTFEGTNTGVFGESPPTGKKVKVSGCMNIHFNNQGTLSQEDVFYNELELLQQLGYTLSPPIVE